MLNHSNSNLLLLSAWKIERCILLGRAMPGYAKILSLVVSELTQGKYYVPYIADEFIKREDDVYFNLAGIAVNDPILGDSTLAQQGTESARR